MTEIVTRLADVSAQAWDACANPDPATFNPFLSHGFLKALEDAGSVGGRGALLENIRTSEGRVVSLIRPPENDILLSAASVWEIAVKHALGRLPHSRRASNRSVGTAARSTGGSATSIGPGDHIAVSSERS